MIAIIDNYDSFTYNLVQYVGELTASTIPIEVYRNDEISAERLREKGPTHIIISPGPGRPEDSGASLEIISALKGSVPILGVCLGHQAIAMLSGARVIRAENIKHGKTSEVSHRGQSIFMEIPNPFIASRYHSLIVEWETLPSCIEILAWTEQNEIMAIRHKEYPTLVGIQFHPEAILTVAGKALLASFLKL